MKRRFHAPCNSVLLRGRYTFETLQMQLIKFFCLPYYYTLLGQLNLTGYPYVNCLCVGTMHLEKSFDRWESVKYLQFLWYRI